MGDTPELYAELHALRAENDRMRDLITKIDGCLIEGAQSKRSAFEIVCDIQMLVLIFRIDF